MVDTASGGLRSASSSSSLACHIIWVAGIADLLLPPLCPVCCVVLFQPRLYHISLLHVYVHLRFGFSFLLFSGMCHLAFVSLCGPLSFSSHGRTTPVVFPVICLDACDTHSCCLSNVFISNLIPPCHSTHPSHHLHLIYFLSRFLSSRCCPGLCTIQQSWPDHSFLNLSLRFHWHPPVTQHCISGGL